MAAPGVKANIVFALVQLQSIAVEFDFVKPLIADRHFVAQHGKTRRDKFWHTLTVGAFKRRRHLARIILGDILTL
jgi:hypothetical protein